MRSIDPGRVRRVLDLGCGAGAQVRRLAALLPHATFTGIDISPANIWSAETMRQKDPAAERTHFVLADYMTLRDDPFDLVLSDGVLHYIDAPDDKLAARLAADVAEGGTLIVAMATDCLYNRSFGLARRALRVMRSAAIDGLILRVGRWLHGARDERRDDRRAHSLHVHAAAPPDGSQVSTPARGQWAAIPGTASDAQHEPVAAHARGDRVSCQRGLTFSHDRLVPRSPEVHRPRMIERKPDVLCISSIDWDFIWQGHQEIMSPLAARGTPRAVHREHRRARAARARSAARAAAACATGGAARRDSARSGRTCSCSRRSCCRCRTRGSRAGSTAAPAAAACSAGCARPASRGRSSGRSCRRRWRAT